MSNFSVGQMGHNLLNFRMASAEDTAKRATQLTHVIRRGKHAFIDQENEEVGDDLAQPLSDRHVVAAALANRVQENVLRISCEHR